MPRIALDARHQPAQRALLELDDLGKATILDRQYASHVELAIAHVCPRTNIVNHRRDTVGLCDGDADV